MSLKRFSKPQKKIPLNLGSEFTNATGMETVKHIAVERTYACKIMKNVKTHLLSEPFMSSASFILNVNLAAADRVESIAVTTSLTARIQQGRFSCSQLECFY